MRTSEKSLGSSRRLCNDVVSSDRTYKQLTNLWENER